MFKIVFDQVKTIWIGTTWDYLGLSGSGAGFALLVKYDDHTVTHLLQECTGEKRHYWMDFGHGLEQFKGVSFKC